MHSKNQKVLTRLIAQFKAINNRNPEKLVIAPAALIALCLKKSVSTTWNGITVECRLFKDTEVLTKSDADTKSLGIFLKKSDDGLTLAACNL